MCSTSIVARAAWQVREPLHARSTGRWKNYESELKAALGSLSEDR